jgi:hypothetical protein
MNRIGELMLKRKRILRKMAQILEMRRGSVVRQMVPGKKGGVSEADKRGPYPLFSFKRGGRTVSRRVHSKEEIKRLERQVRNFHRFQELSRRLVEVSEAVCEEKEKGPKGRRPL